MMIDKYLKQFNLTRYRVSTVSGVSESTLRNNNRYPVDSMSVKVIRAIAGVVGKTPGEVLDGLIAIENVRLKK